MAIWFNVVVSLFWVRQCKLTLPGEWLPFDEKNDRCSSSVLKNNAAARLNQTAVAKKGQRRSQVIACFGWCSLNVFAKHGIILQRRKLSGPRAVFFSHLSIKDDELSFDSYRHVLYCESSGAAGVYGWPYHGSARYSKRMSRQFNTMLNYNTHSTFLRIGKRIWSRADDSLVGELDQYSLWRREYRRRCLSKYSSIALVLPALTFFQLNLSNTTMPVILYLCRFWYWLLFLKSTYF